MRLFIGILLFFIILASCSSEEVKNYEVGSDFLDDDVTVKVIDTFSIRASTFKLDSLVTSDTGRILLGHIQDDDLGGLTAQSYFQLLTTDFDISVEATYDSIGFIMNYDKYYYGDTIKEQTYKLHRIIETVEPKDDDVNDFYYIDSLLYDDEIIGQITFKPRPNRESDSLYIPINSDIGEDLFNAIQDNDIISSTNFLDEFKGIAIIPAKTNSSMLGFNIETTEDTDANTYMRLFYTLDDGDDENSYYIDFVISDLSKQFNQIKSDFSKSLLYADKLNVLDDPEESLSSDETGNKTFIQGNSGVSTKIEMPSIKKLNEISLFGSTLEAELTFKPARDSYDSTSDLPESLLVYIINKNNAIQSQLYDIDGNEVYAVLNEDIDEFDNGTFYTIDVSGYVEQILASELDLDYSLMIQFVDYDTVFDKIAIEDNNDDLKLSIKYLNY